MMTEKATGNIEFAIEGQDPPTVEVVEPITQEPLLLYKPEYRFVTRGINVVKCEDADSFAEALTALHGDNGLVELRTDGTFRYISEVGPTALHDMTFMLKEAPTAVVLSSRDYSQQELLKWHEQWPETLQAVDKNPELVWEKISAYTSRGVTKAEIVSTDEGISVMVERGEAPESYRYPRFWTAKSPLYEGHTELEATLRLTIKEPTVSRETGNVDGSLTFAFELWNPDKRELLKAGMEDAAAKMALLLPTFTIIRGNIKVGQSSGGMRSGE